MFLLSVITHMMDQMSTLKQNSPLWLESICTSMETWMTMASMKVRNETRHLDDMKNGKSIKRQVVKWQKTQSKHFTVQLELSFVALRVCDFARVLICCCCRECLTVTTSVCIIMEWINLTMMQTAKKCVCQLTVIPEWICSIYRALFILLTSF